MITYGFIVLWAIPIICILFALGLLIAIRCKQ